jgi:hypothetical protein
VTQLPFAFEEPEKATEGRHAQMMAWIDAWSKDDGPQIKAAVYTTCDNDGSRKRSFTSARLEIEHL